MLIEKKKSLKEYNTLKVESVADIFVDIQSTEDLQALSKSQMLKDQKILFLGGGSNILFTGNFNGIVLHSVIDTIEISSENEEEITLKVGSGVVWDKFVEYCVARNWGGIENLSDIPGNVGSAPVQNIGAYGTEAKETISRVHTYDLNNNRVKVLDNIECEFGYRSSIFKKSHNNKLFVTHVEFTLCKKPRLNTSYGHVEEALQYYSEKNIKNLRNAIIKIRQNKLPPVAELASAGSFFKNPVLEPATVNAIIKEYPDIPRFPAENKKLKVPAAWLIEQCGLKGVQKGNVGTYKNQPLVIVNINNASGQEIVEFSNYIRDEVYKKFGIRLEPEVCFI